MTSPDHATAQAFAASWNHVGTVYQRRQFLEWMAPIDPTSLEGKDILEMGFGNGSLLAHMGAFHPRRLAGVELGDTVEQTRRNLAHVPPGILDLHSGDLTTADLGEFDLVYSIGVLHHLKSPRLGFDAVLRHTKPGARFHCWVYAHEGNLLVRLLVEPVRRVACHLPWWLAKYFVALPLVVPYFLFAKMTPLFPRLARRLPLGLYSLWISDQPFGFFHHVAFDQIVTPQTVYLRRAEIEEWLRDTRIDPGSTYVEFRNGNSWKLGGRRKGQEAG